MTWTWRYEDEGGAVVEPAPSDEAVSAAAAEAFPSQADAESWLGEVWRELLDGGVHQVVLYDGDRKVYGPMGLTEG